MLCCSGVPTCELAVKAAIMNFCDVALVDTFFLTQQTLVFSFLSGLQTTGFFQFEITEFKTMRKLLPFEAMNRWSSG